MPVSMVDASRDTEQRLRMVVLGAMASALAHELNQPLTAIIAYADACQELVESGKMEQRQLLEVLRSISGQAERAGKIIHRLRTLVRRGEPVRAPLDVNDVVRNVAGLLAPDARRSGVHVRLNLADGLPQPFADSVLMQQVVLNLMRNGLEAIDESHPVRRELTVETGRSPDDAVEISVTDSGTGFPPEHAARIFEPFFTTRATGLGIGLPVCRTIVESHGGRICVTSDAGCGVTALVTLPVAEPRARNAS
jgi:C4-dicarboxylate-specific signal transduction histidine kinase